MLSKPENFSSLFVGGIPHRAKLFDGMSKPLIATLLGIELEIKKVFNRDVKRFRNSFATVNRRCIDPAFHETNKLNRIAAFLRKLCLG
jgi:hypothetical protein